MMEVVRLPATPFRCAFCQRCLPLFGLRSALAPRWKWRTLPPRSVLSRLWGDGTHSQHEPTWSATRKLESMNTDIRSPNSSSSTRISSYFRDRQSRSKKTLSNARPRPSMLMAMPRCLSGARKSAAAPCSTRHQDRGRQRHERQQQQVFDQPPSRGPSANFLVSHTTSSLAQITSRGGLENQ
jgi:hypothetical protein